MTAKLSGKTVHEMRQREDVAMIKSPVRAAGLQLAQQAELTAGVPSSSSLVTAGREKQKLLSTSNRLAAAGLCA